MTPEENSPVARVGKNQAAWLAIDADCDILGQVKKKGAAELTIEQIRKHREPRLLTKTDEESRLPAFLRDNGLAILSKSPTQFLVGTFQAFEHLPDLSGDAVTLVDDSDLLMLQGRTSSEASGLLLAINTGMIEAFLEDGPARLATMGRMGSGPFNYRVAGYEKLIKVTGTQIEIDAGVETAHSAAIIEAKTSDRGSFLVRQLYYPYRTWTNKLGKKKKVRPVFLVISNDRFSFLEYRFNDPKMYSSIELVKKETFQLRDSLIAPEILLDYLGRPLAPVPLGIPYPQANSVDRIVSLLISIEEAGGELCKEDVATQQVFDGRQADYYLNAALYLGLIRLRVVPNRVYELTDAGSKVVGADAAQRTQLLAERLVRDPVVRAVSRVLLDHPGESRTADLARFAAKEIEVLSADGAMPEVGMDSTLRRRAATMVSWARWVQDHTSSKSPTKS